MSLRKWASIKTILVFDILTYLIMIYVRPNSNRIWSDAIKISDINNIEKINFLSLTTEQYELLQSVASFLIGTSTHFPETHLDRLTHFRIDSNFFKANMGITDSTLTIGKDLMNRLNKKEFISIVAHEIGHRVSGTQINQLTPIVCISTFLPPWLVMSTSLLQLLLVLTRGPISGRKEAFINLMEDGLKFLVLAGIPILVMNYYARDKEYEADHYATLFTQDPEALIQALNKVCPEAVPTNFFLSILTELYHKTVLDHPSFASRVQEIEHNACAEYPSLSFCR